MFLKGTICAETAAAVPWTSEVMHSDQQALGSRMEIDTESSSVGQLEAPPKTFGEGSGQHDPEIQNGKTYRGREIKRGRKKSRRG